METNTLTFNNLNREISNFVDDFVETYKSILISQGKTATGNLVKSIKSEPNTIENNIITGQISLAEYWKYVEYGRKPGKFPPKEKISKWIDDKGIQLPTPSNGITMTKQQLTFLISRKIAQYGIKPGNQFEEALEITWKNHEILMNRAIQKDIDEFLNKI